MNLPCRWRSIYREIARGTQKTGLKIIFETQTDEEVVHNNAFKKLAEKSDAKVVESNILANAKNIFAEMKKYGTLDLTGEAPQIEAYRKAMVAEKEVYTFDKENFFCFPISYDRNWRERH